MRIAILALLLLAAKSSAFATIIIDEFADYHEIETTTPGTGSHELDGLGVLGGSRELSITAFASSLVGGARININDSKPDALFYDPTRGPDGAVAQGQIIWDGNQDDNSDPQGFNAGGLGGDNMGVDLTAGDLIRVVVNSSLPSDDSTLTIEVASDGGANLATKSLPLPTFGSSMVTNYDFPFADFAGIDFSDVSAMQLKIDTSSDPRLQIEIERAVVTTNVPEPTSLALVVTMLGLGFGIRKRQG